MGGRTRGELTIAEKYGGLGLGGRDLIVFNQIWRSQCRDGAHIATLGSGYQSRALEFNDKSSGHFRRAVQDDAMR